jgi:NACHT domain- and WD repeat-containing protein
LPSSNRTFRVFVSSTFSDLKEERDALQKRVFPKLRELCMQHGCRFQAIDLRWGVREEAGYDQQTLRICLEEIRRCQKTKLKPNFIVLLGDRYGWRPAPPEIPQDEFEEIEKGLSQEDIALLRKWYLLDSNAVPPVCCLQPRVGEYKKQEIWETLENQLRLILIKGIAEMKLSEKALAKYFESATEQEISQGLSDPEAQRHVFCFFRKIEGIKENPQKDFVDLDKTISRLDDEAYIRLSALKDKLRTCLPNHCFEYQASLTNNGISKNHIDKLCEDVCNSLERVIQEEIKHISEVDPLDKEIDGHRVFGEERARFFVGRQEALRSIKDYLVGDSRQPLAVFGESGSGKTSLMAEVVRETRQSFPDVEVVFRFIGATPSSTDGRSLLESLCKQIYKIFDFEEQKHEQFARVEGTDEESQQKLRQIEAEYTILAEYQKLSLTFRDFIKKIPKDKRAVIFLDALDQLSAANGIQNLSWLPSSLPENVKIVLSCLPGKCRSVLEKTLPPRNVILLKLMSREEGKDLLEKWLSNEGRRLRLDQELEVLDKFTICGMPLYLKVAFEEISRWKSYTERKELNSTVTGLILDMFKRLSSNENYGEKVFSHSLGYLAASKNGLTEDELLDVLSLDSEVFDDFKKGSFHELTGNRLPIVVWSRLYFDLEPYLTEWSADGTSLLRFYHRQLNEVAFNKYLVKNLKNKFYKKLANYFAEQPTWFDSEKKRPNIRKVSELPFQQTNSELWLQLEKSLCDIDFIEAKCAAGMTFDLASDYARLNIDLTLLSPPIVTFFLHENQFGLRCPICLEWSKMEQEQLGQILVCPACSNELRSNNFFIKAKWYPKKEEKNLNRANRENKFKFSEELSDFYGFVLKHSHILSRHSNLVFQQVANELWTKPSIKDRIQHKIDLNSEKRPWTRWINNESPEGICLLTLSGHLDEVLDCAFSPDGRRIVSASSDQTLKLWQTSNGAELITLTGHSQLVRVCKFSPDGNQILSGSSDGTLKVWDVETGQVILTLEGHKGAITSCAFSPDGLQILSGSKDKTLKLWDARTGSEIATLSGDIDCFSGIKLCCFTLDGRNIVAQDDSGHLLVWDAVSKVEKVNLKADRTVPSFVSAPDGRVLFWRTISQGDWFFDGYDVLTGTGIGEYRISPGNKNFVFSPDGTKIVAIAFYGDDLFLHDGFTLKTLGKFGSHNDTVNSIAFSPNGNLVISASSDKTLKVWDISKAVEFTRLLENSPASARLRKKSERNSIYSCAISPVNRQIAAGHYCGLDVWDSKGMTLLLECKEDLEKYGSVTSCSFSPDGSIIVSGTYNMLHVWDGKKGFLLKEVACHHQRITACSFSPNGKYIVSASEKYTVHYSEKEKIKENGHIVLWALENYSFLEKSNIQDISPPLLRGRFAVFSPDGLNILTDSDLGYLSLINVGSGKEIKCFFFDHYLKACAFSPNGEQIVVCTDFNYAKPYELLLVNLEDSDGKEVVIGSHNAALTACAFSPDGKYVLSGSEDGWVTVWDTQSKNKISEYCVEFAVKAVSWSHSGSILVVGDDKGGLHVLKIENLIIGTLILTAWDSPRDHLLAFGCPVCLLWSEISPIWLGLETQCQHCGAKIKLNLFTIDDDWRQIARSWRTCAIVEYMRSIMDKIDADPILKTYVPLNCSMSNGGEQLVEEATRFWLAENSGRVLTFLGGYGVGKTAICKKICHDLCSDFISGTNKTIIPILIGASDFSSSLSLTKGLDFFEVLKKHCSVFSTVEKEYEFVIILDGFEEIAKSNKNMALQFLSKLLATKQKTILTCRTNYFKTERDCLTFLTEAIQKGLEIENLHSARALLELKYIVEFNQSDMQDFIKSVFGDPDWAPFSKIFWTYDLEDLSKTPIMLDWLSRILPKINNKNIRSRDLIYSSLINSWLKRDDGRGVNQNALIEIMKILAEDMVFRNATEISSVALSEKVQRRFLQRDLAQTSLEGFDSMVRLSGFLSRDSTGIYSFTHRSIMEYFFAMVLIDKIKENHLTLYRDDEHLLYPESGDLAFGLGPGFSKKNASGPILEKINLKSGNNFSEVYPLSRGFIELFGSMLARDKMTGEVAGETYQVFTEKQGLRDDETVLYSDAEVMKGNKDQEAIDPKKSKRAYKRVRMIGGEGRIYYNFNVYNFSLLVNGQNTNDKWGILVSKTRSWIHT